MFKLKKYSSRLGSKKANIGFMLILKVVYEVIFALVTSKLYAYIGLWYDPNYMKLIISYIAAILLIIIMPNSSDRVSNYLIYIFYYFTILPLLSLYWQQNQSSTYILFCILSFVALCISTIFFDRTKMGNNIRIIKGTIDLEGILCVVCIVLLTVVTFLYGIPNSKALDFNNIYTLRAEKNYSGLGGYLINWLPKALIPSLLALSIYHRKRVLIVLAVIFQFYMYLMTANKTVLFSIFFIIGIYVLLDLFKNKCMYYLAIGLTTLHGIGVFVLTFFGKFFMFATISYRLSAVPANVSYQHYNFFSENPKLHFAENFIGRLFGIKSPYQQISTRMLGYGGSNANTGILGDAYDNGGLLVMLIYMIVLGFVFAYVDKKINSSNLHLIPVITTILSYNIIGLNDTALTVVLITGGLLINLFIIHIIIENDKHKICSRKEFV